MDNLESTVNAEPVVNVEPQEPIVKAEPTNEPVNAGTGVTPPKVDDKPAQSPEENTKYAAIRREAEAKAEARAKDKLISEMYGESHGIHTYAEYQKAVEREQEQQRRAKLQEKGIDPTEIEEIINNHPKVKKSDEVLSKLEQEQMKQKEYQEFFDYFKAKNNRAFSSETDQISTEVWLMTAEFNPDGTPNQNRKSLKDAWVYNYNGQLEAKIAEYEAKLKAQETNEKNANSSPGSVTGNGEIKGDFISFDTFQANKQDPSWVNKNFKTLMDSRAKW